MSRFYSKPLAWQNIKFPKLFYNESQDRNQRIPLICMPRDNSASHVFCGPHRHVWLDFNPKTYPIKICNNYLTESQGRNQRIPLICIPWDNLARHLFHGPHRHVCLDFIPNTLYHYQTCNNLFSGNLKTGIRGSPWYVCQEIIWLATYSVDPTDMCD